MIRERVDRAVPGAAHRRNAGPPSWNALRRPAPAGRDGPGDRPPALALPDGRAAVQPGRGHAHRAAHGDLLAGPLSRRDHGLRHARPGRGPDPGRQGRHNEPRRPAGRRHPGAGLQRPGHRVHRGVPQLPADQPRRATVRAARTSASCWASATSSCACPGRTRGPTRSSPSTGRYITVGIRADALRPDPDGRDLRAGARPGVPRPRVAGARGGGRGAGRHRGVPRRGVRSTPGRRAREGLLRRLLRTTGDRRRGGPRSSPSRTVAPTAARTWCSGWSRGRASRSGENIRLSIDTERMLLFGEDGRRIDKVETLGRAGPVAFVATPRSRTGACQACPARARVRASGRDAAQAALQELAQAYGVGGQGRHQDARTGERQDGQALAGVRLAACRPRRAARCRPPWRRRARPCSRHRRPAAARGGAAGSRRP